MRTGLKVLAVGLTLGAIAAHAQAPAVPLRDQLRERFDIVATQDGLGLVPRQRGGDVRFVEVRDGAVAINGEPVTAREARTRLGRDADLIFRITYLDAAGQRELAGGSATVPPVPGVPSSPLPPTSPPSTSLPPAPPTPPMPPAPPSPPRTEIRRGDIVRFGGSVTVAREEQVDGNVVVIGGSADIDGEVDGDVAVIGGSLDLGPEAVVTGDVDVIGGSLDRAPGARIDGKVDDVGFGPGGRGRVSGPDRDRDGSVIRTPSDFWSFWSPFWRVGSLVATLLRVILLILGALVVVAVGGRFVSAVAERTATEPVRAGVAGLLAEVLFVPLLVVTTVVLAVSIVGIPLLLLVPFALVLSLVMLLVGYTGVAIQVGRVASSRLGITPGPYASVALGVAAICAISMVARLIGLAGDVAFGGFVAGFVAILGYLVEYIAWTVGAGAVILTWLRSRRRPGLPFIPAMQPVSGIGDPAV